MNNEYKKIEYWLANVEILDNTDYILNNRKAKILIRYLKEKDKEIERLNNIIDELEKWLEEDLKQQYRDCGHRNNIIREVYNKLNELKGDNK